MINIKALAVATALSAGVVFALPVTTSEAMPVGPVKIQAVNDGGIVNVHYKKKWSKKRWARYCRWADDWRCYRRHRHARLYRYRYYARIITIMIPTITMTSTGRAGTDRDSVSFSGSIDATATVMKGPHGCHAMRA